MIKLTSKQKGTKSFINRRGLDLSVSAKFLVTEQVLPGEQQIKVHDTLGLLPGAELDFSIDDGLGPVQKHLEVESVSIGQIILTEPINFGLPRDTIISIDYDTKGILVAPGRDITRDYVEMNRRIRVPQDIVIAGGSSVFFRSSHYFVSGYQVGDSSLSLNLKLANETITWCSRDDSFSTEPVETTNNDDDDILGWNTPKLEETDKEWPEYPQLIVKGVDIPAYHEQLSIYSDLEDPGYIPRLNRMYVVPIWIPIKVGDIIKTDTETLRVLGKDVTRIRNMQALAVDYYKGVE